MTELRPVGHALNEIIERLRLDLTPSAPRTLRAAPFAFQPTFKVFLSVSHRPRIDGKFHGDE